jgi:hypothetical protein
MQRSHWLAASAGLLAGVVGFIALCIVLDLDLIRWSTCTGPFRQAVDARSHLCVDSQVKTP